MEAVLEEDQDGADPYERDTQAPEEEDLMALLLPGGNLPTSNAAFSLQYHGGAFSGWVKQRSPACAAASLAGSWNALMALGRSTEGALNQDDVLDVMRDNLQRTIDKRRKKIDRLLGAPFAPVDAALRARVASEGKSFGGKQKTGEGVSSRHCIQLLRQVVAEVLASGEPQTPDESTEQSKRYRCETSTDVPAEACIASCAACALNTGLVAGTEMVNRGETSTDARDGMLAFCLLDELIKAEDVASDEPQADVDAAAMDTGPGMCPVATQMHQLSCTETSTSELARPLPRLNDVGGSVRVVEGEGEGTLTNKGLKGSRSSTSWKWREDICAYYTAVGGMEKLMRERPSTGYFGNQDVASAMRSLCESHGGVNCRVLPLAGRMPPKGQSVAEGYIRLAPGDDEERALQQWRALQVSFFVWTPMHRFLPGWM